MSKLPTGWISVLLILSINPTEVFAGAGLDQRLRAAQQQRALQAQRQQQALIQQRQAQQQAVIRREIVERQAQVIAQQRALQMQAVAQRQRAIQGQAQVQAVRQQQAAYQQAMLSQQAQYQQQLRQLQTQQSRQFQQIQQPQSVPIQQYDNSGPFIPSSQPLFEPYVEEVVDMKTIWRDMEITSEAWPLIIDLDSKEVIVAKFMEDFREQGVVMKKSARHYVQMIDSMSFENPDMLKNPFDRVLQTVAIIEYDFDNGANPDALARQILGEKGYNANKKRLKR